MADLVAWPARLPNPDSSGYSYQAQAPFIRTNMDTGRARQRRRFITIPTTVSVEWTFTQEMLALFEAFVHYDLLDGVCWFAATIVNGMETNSVKARFTQAYKVDSIDAFLWKVTSQLETLAMPIASMEEYIALRDFGEDAIHSASSDLHTLIHTDLPGALAW